PGGFRQARITVQCAADHRFGNQGRGLLLIEENQRGSLKRTVWIIEHQLKIVGACQPEQRIKKSVLPEYFRFGTECLQHKWNGPRTAAARQCFRRGETNFRTGILEKLAKLWLRTLIRHA